LVPKCELNFKKLIFEEFEVFLFDVVHVVHIDRNRTIDPQND